MKCAPLLVALIAPRAAGSASGDERRWLPGSAENVAAVVAEQRCADAPPAPLAYEPGEVALVEKHSHISGVFVHGKILSVGLGGRRADKPEDEVYRIEYDPVDIGDRFERGVPRRRLFPAPLRCDTHLSSSPAYRFVVGDHLDGRVGSCGENEWGAPLKYNATCGTVCSLRCEVGYVPTDGSPPNTAEPFVCGHGIWHRANQLDDSGSVRPRWGCRRRQDSDPSAADPRQILPHEVLGVVKGAGPSEVQSAYRKASAIFHPDVGGNAGEFRAVSNARDALMLEIEEARLRSELVGLNKPGLQVERTKIVECEQAQKTKFGDRISMHYTGFFASDNTQFDSSKARGADGRGKPYELVLGEGKAIEGFEHGMLDICVGEERTLVVPPELAYGDKGRAKIPPGATLVFEVELLAILPKTSADPQ